MSWKMPLIYTLFLWKKKRKGSDKRKMTGKVKDEDELQEQVSCQRRATEESIRWTSFLAVVFMRSTFG